MSSTAAPSLPHRSIANIRTETGPSTGGPANPHTPSRTVSSTFGSPSSLRAEDDNIVIELGSRFIKLGFAGEAAPKAVLSLGPEQLRRVGDFRNWDPEHKDDWRRRPTGKTWGVDHELWQYDVRTVDLGLVEDKIDRAIREALNKFLLIDSRPRRTSLVLSSSTPLPLLSATLDVLFYRFQAPTVSLMSSAVMSTVGAGTRSALIVDLGWAETTVTSVYEYREVRTTRTVRAGKMLVNETHNLLQDALSTTPVHAQRTRCERDQGQHSLSFEECEELACRLVWCRQLDRGDLPGLGKRQQQTQRDVLPTVEEQDESVPPSPVSQDEPKGDVDILLQSVEPPENLTLPYQQLSEPCENTYFAPQYSRSSFDDDELPIHNLLYQHLVQLPIDARATCMSRIIFIGGCSRVIGLRRRIFDELSKLVHERGWDPVQGRAPQRYLSNTLLKRAASRQASEGPTDVELPAKEVEELRVADEDAPRNAADVIEDSLKKRESHHPKIQGVLRPLGSLGPWGGASLACQLKVVAMANVDRDIWLQQGANGASRPNEVDVKTQQRQSMGPGGLMRGAAGQATWTLGAWGHINTGAEKIVRRRNELSL
ncbi:actin-related protein 10 [Colletotrichum spaethianum]|uniref:Actin-related protein 10 n=1 Tax=Colletotrichum spaethianum TaxID=700344 RepID=A0AA37PC27_9PEZI|nr:actin-related protein 10 [Colletotrichum spaethianum]GKT49467.1 actin-related protein 10 [Colletotrichum spaethianum]